MARGHSGTKGCFKNFKAIQKSMDKTPGLKTELRNEWQKQRQQKLRREAKCLDELQKVWTRGYRYKTCLKVLISAFHVLIKCMLEQNVAVVGSVQS